MRTREEIKTQVSKIDRPKMGEMGAVIIELLLDIRDLLEAQKK